jgi:hypothetical protein
MDNRGSDLKGHKNYLHYYTSILEHLKMKLQVLHFFMGLPYISDGGRDKKGI